MCGNCVKRQRGMTLAMVALLFGSLAAPVVGAPIFPFPAGTHPPGFVIHLPPIGPLPFGPATAVGPMPFFDTMPNPADGHHWEIELFNGGPLIDSVNVIITVPGGGTAFLGNITLGGGAAAYWDIVYADIPEVGGPYLFTASNPPGGPPFWTLDSAVIEYNTGLSDPPMGGPIFGGLGFGAVSPFVVGAPTITLGISVAPVPEPGLLLTSAAGALGLLALIRARNRKRILTLADIHRKVH